MTKQCCLRFLPSNKSSENLPTAASLYLLSSRALPCRPALGAPSVPLYLHCRGVCPWLHPLGSSENYSCLSPHPNILLASVWPPGFLNSLLPGLFSSTRMTLVAAAAQATLQVTLGLQRWILLTQTDSLRSKCWGKEWELPLPLSHPGPTCRGEEPQTSTQTCLLFAGFLLWDHLATQHLLSHISLCSAFSPSSLSLASNVSLASAFCMQVSRERLFYPATSSPVCPPAAAAAGPYLPTPPTFYPHPGWGGGSPGPHAHTCSHSTPARSHSTLSTPLRPDQPLPVWQHQGDPPA